jgi:hypothetical protein
MLPRLLRLARLAAALLLGVTGSLTLTATSASAEPLAITCTGTVGQTFHPGLTLTLRQNSFQEDGTLTCAPVPFDQDYSFVDLSIHGEGSMNCLLTEDVEVSGQLHWAGGGTSHFVGTIAVALRPLGVNVVYQEAVITGGPFQGRTLRYPLAMYSPEPLDCLGDGVQFVSGPTSVIIL